MALTADEMIAALSGFEPNALDEDADVGRLNSIMDGFATLDHRERVIPAIFALMERHPDAYLGSPGPLVHSVESVGLTRFEPLLIASIERRPAQSTVWMVNRILNSNLQSERRKFLLDLLRSVLDHPKATASVARRADNFLKFQTQRDAQPLA